MPSTTPPDGAAGSRARGPGASPADAGWTGTRGAGPRRRSLLAGTAGALIAAQAVAGCTDGGESPAERRRRIDAAQRLRRAAAQDSEALLTRYTSTAAVHPALGGRLAPLREAVARHVEAFGGSASGSASGSHRGESGGNPSAAPGVGPEGGPGGEPGGGQGAGPKAGTDAGTEARNRMAVPGDEGRALGTLADAERRTADARMRALVDAPPELARLLASVAAAGSAHAYLLTEGDAA